jgi:hypothetical protein
MPPYLQSIAPVRADRTTLRFQAEFVPWQDMRKLDYPLEVVFIDVLPTGEVRTFPIESTKQRSWYHRHTLDGKPADLCLWFPHDPPERRWGWPQPFSEYLAIVSRHLQAEEFYRRHGYWPMEDVPHGAMAMAHPDGGKTKQHRRKAS